MTTYPTNYKEWLAKIISFNTVSRNPNIECVQYIADYLKTVGIKGELIHDPKRKTHANLWATLPGEGGVTQGGLVLSGHTDVVPCDGQAWDTDPFQMVEKDGKLYGRGTSDMKGFIAIVLALTPQFLAMKRTKPIHYAFSFDEEVGCTGVSHMIEYLKQRGFKADGCIIGEPSNLMVAIANKGMYTWNVEVKGQAIHSSMALMNTSCNAIEYAAMIIAKIREIALDLKKNGPQDSLNMCPHSCITTGMIKGGIAVNTVPAECNFVFSVRITDTKIADDVEQRVTRFIEENILPAMREEYKDAKVHLELKSGYPAFNGKEDTFTKHVRNFCNDHEVRKGAGGTEAGYFQDVLGIPTVIVGPGMIQMAHVANEYIRIDMMDKYVQILLDMVNLYCVRGEGCATALTSGHL